MPRPRKKPAASPVPNLHFILICVTFLLLVLSGVAYAVVPDSRAAQFSTIISLMIGFLTGKLSNGFGKTLNVTPTVNAAEEEDETA
jgi:hypothetical protein